MSQITVSNLTFAYDGSYDNIFENVSFIMDTDWKLGFIGRNGRGKTTFLNLLLGKYKFQGSIKSSVDMQYFPFQVADPNLYTIDIAQSLNPHLADWQLLRELSLLNVGSDVLYRSFNTLSHGEQTKVMLAILFLKENSFLLIDEPTNHLDIAGREILSKYLNSKKGFILVSHDRTCLDSCVDHILSINKSNIQIQKGNFSSWWQNKENQDNFELMENEKLKANIQNLTKAAKRTATWSNKVEKTKFGNNDASGIKPDKGYIGHKAAKMMQRSKAIETRRASAIEEKSKLLKNLERADDLKISPLPYYKNTIMEANNLAIFYDERKIADSINFKIEQGEKIALQGANGCGKTSLIKLILGQSIDYTGDITMGSNLKISYVAQDTSFLKGSLQEWTEKTNIDQSLFLTILRKLDFSRLQFVKDMADFSQGQKKKVLLAQSLSEQAHLYIWDEPLNYIDVFSRMQIENLLLSYKPTILFVEHDQTFTNKIADKIIHLKSN